MSSIAEGLDLLSDIIPSVPEKTVASLVVIGLTFGIVYLVNRVRLRLARGDELRAPIIDLSLSALVAIVIGVGVAVIAGIWGVAATAVDAIAQSGIGFETVSRLGMSLLLIAVAYLAVGFSRRFIDELIAAHEAVTEHHREVTYRIIQVGIYITAGIIILGVWQVDLSGLLIGAGFLGIILGFAARQSIAAVISGFILMFSRPFEIGDWIEVGDNEGIVTDITAFNTRIQTFDGEYVIVPNDEISSQTITNRSRKGRLRLRVRVGVDYDTDLEHAAEVIRESIRDLDEILSVPTPQVVLTEFGESAIIFEMKFWIDNPSARRRWRAIQAVVKSVNRAFKREGIKIPFPQRELTGRRELGGFRVITDDDPGSEIIDSQAQSRAEGDN